jgi:CheY-like chemotaxis protein
MVVLHKFMSTPLTSQGTVLLVDDYPAGMLIGTLMIEHLGYVVEGVSSGSEAIDKVRASTKPFMVILMDVQMSDMDGLEATKIIRKLEQEKGYCNTIIAVTAHALAGDRERFLKAGMNDYISKPIHPDILAQKLAVLAKAMRSA